MVDALIFGDPTCLTIMQRSESESLAVAIQPRSLRLRMTQCETTRKHTGHASPENVQFFAHETSHTCFV